MMRIAFLIATVHDLGGTAGAVATQANALVTAGHEVEILSVYRSGDDHHFPLDDRVQVRDLVDLGDPAGGRVRVAGAPELDGAEAARLRGRPTILIEPGQDPGLDALADVALEVALPGLGADVLVTVTPALLAYAVRLTPPRIAVVHQEHRSSAQRPNGRALLLDSARRADVIASLTEPMAVWLREQLGQHAAETTGSPRVVTVPNAVPPGYRPRSLLTEPVICSAGRLVNEKQWTHLVGAFALVADRLPGWRVRIFGDGPARFDLRGTTRKLGLWDRVELPGPTSDLASEWTRASISALTSQPGEGFPLVIQEAMAAGVPVVAYDMPSGPRDQIDDGVDGLLVAQGSREGLAAALLRLAGDRDERLRMGAAARAKATTWDSGTITTRWIEIFEQAVARRAERPTGGRATAVLRGLTGAPLTGAVDAADTPVTDPQRSTARVTPVQAREAALAAGVRAAGAAADQVPDGVWWVVPPRAGSPATIAMSMSMRRSFLSALSDLSPRDLPSWLSLRDPEERGWPSRRGAAAELVPDLVRGRTSRLLLEPWPDPAGVVGRDCEVAVEFWEAGPDGDLHSPGRAAYTTVMPSEVELVTAPVLGSQVPTHPIMLGPTPADCTFDIDVVLTWVDGADPVWEAARAARLTAESDPGLRDRAASGRARYLDRGELRYSLRSLHLFAPWVRTIHLVTAGQTPDWLDPDHPRINLVDHRDILPAEALPTFNSHAIETSLHHIEGLAEHFVYLNDDTMLGTPVWPETFFTPAGDTTVVLSTGLVGLPGQQQLPYARAAARNRRLLEDTFGVTPVHTLAHAPYPHRRSVLTAVAEQYPEEVRATAHSAFRSPTDVSMLSSLAQHYGLITGTAQVAPTDPPGSGFAYVDIAEVNVARKLRDLSRRTRTGFCLGDSHDFARDEETVQRLVTDFLADYYPIAAPWER